MGFPLIEGLTKFKDVSETMPGVCICSLLLQLMPAPSHQPLGFSSFFVQTRKSLAKVIIMFLVYPRREAEGSCGRSGWEHSHVVVLLYLLWGKDSWPSEVQCRKFVKCFA